MSGKNAPRVFDFPRETSLFEAIPVIVAALEDEGLALSVNDNSRFADINTFLLGRPCVPEPVKRVVVPAHRIIAKG